MYALFHRYRWQLGLAPFFVASIWIAITQGIANDQGEFITISVFYAIADVLMVNAFVAETRRVRALSQACALGIFTGVFMFTLVAYREAQYMPAQPLFWVAGWKVLASEFGRRWYPKMLNETTLGWYMIGASTLVGWLYATTSFIPTWVNLLQFFGVAGFGLALAVAHDVRRFTPHTWSIIGASGLTLYTAMCLADVLQKYMNEGVVIATPLVAFFAALPVAIVAVRDSVRSFNGRSSMFVS